MDMNNNQEAFLRNVAQKIQRLMEVAQNGHAVAYFRLGSRMINGKEVVLKLVVEEISEAEALKSDTER